MKPVVLLLTGSLSVNLLLVAWIALRSPAPTNETRSGSADTSSRASIAEASAPEILSTTAWRTLHDDDLRTFAFNLRSAGLADHLVRAIVAAEIDERFRAREEALVPTRPPLKYWQADTYREPLEAKLARLDLKREKARQRLDILGPDAAERADAGFIPAAKHELAHMITEDYDTVIADLGQQAGQMPLPAEAAMLASLEEEKKRELAALFTPEELKKYEMLNSPNVQWQRTQFATFAPTEAEFLAIYTTDTELQQSLRQLSWPSFGDFETRDAYLESLHQTQEAREVFERASEDQLRTELGDERYHTYLRERDPHLHDIRTLVDRAGLPRETAERVYDLRSAATRASFEVGNNYGTSVAARKTALHDLATDVRTQAQAMLGPAAAEAYFKSGNDWLRQIEQGNIVQLTRGGWGARGVTETPPPPQP